MLAKDLIIKDFPYLLPTDTGNKALDIMENYLIEHLAVVDDNSLLGIVNMDDVYNFELFETEIKNFKQPLPLVYIFENQHIFDVVKTISAFNLTILPTINDENFYTGTITYKSITNKLSELLPIKENGFYLLFSMPVIDYSPTEITGIVERNEAKLLCLYINENPNSSKLDVYLKIQTNDLGSLLQALEKYEYDFTVLNPSKNDYDDILQERLDNLLNFLNI